MEATLTIYDEDSRTVKELLDEMTGEEMYSAQYETSNQYNAIVVAKAIEIVRKHTRLTNAQLTTKLSVSRNTYYNWLGGKIEVTNKRFELSMEKLALIREIAGEDYGIHKQTR